MEFNKKQYHENECVETKDEAMYRLKLRGCEYIEMKSGRCGCGETPHLLGLGFDGNILGEISICEVCGDDKKENMKEEKNQVSEQEQTSFRELVNLCRDIEDLYGHELDD